MSGQLVHPEASPRFTCFERRRTAMLCGECSMQNLHTLRPVSDHVRRQPPVRMTRTGVRGTPHTLENACELKQDVIVCVQNTVDVNCVVPVGMSKRITKLDSSRRRCLRANVERRLGTQRHVKIGRLPLLSVHAACRQCHDIGGTSAAQSCLFFCGKQLLGSAVQRRPWLQDHCALRTGIFHCVGEFLSSTSFHVQREARTTHGHPS
jgi:hypothetical protein